MTPTLDFFCPIEWLDILLESLLHDRYHVAFAGIRSLNKERIYVLYLRLLYILMQQEHVKCE